MADAKISQLTDGDPAQSGDQVPVNRGGVNRRITAGSIVNLDHATNHQSGGSDEVSVNGLLGVLGDTQKVSLQDEGVFVSERRTLNFVGSGVSVADDVGNSRVNITIAGASPAPDFDAQLLALFWG